MSFKGSLLVSKHAISYMRKSGGGSIVNILGWRLKGGPKAVAYHILGRGLVNMARTMVVDYGRKGIRVNCVVSKDVDILMLREEARQLGISFQEFLKKTADRQIGRKGGPEDVANVILFLANELSSWIAGFVIAVDRGGLA